jgi:hypothetical protein
MSRVCWRSCAAGCFYRVAGRRCSTSRVGFRE